jgi:hypothetical protein
MRRSILLAILFLTASGASAQQPKAKPLAGWLGVFPEFQGYSRTFDKPRGDKSSYEQTATYEWTGGRIETVRITLIRDVKVAQGFTGDALKALEKTATTVPFGQRSGYLLVQQQILVIPLGDDRLVRIESITPVYRSDLPAFAKKLNLDACAKALEQPPRTDGRSLERFRALKKGMPLSDVSAWVGDSNLDIGSGIHMLVYPLADGPPVTIGFPDFGKLLYVRQIVNGKPVDLVK